MDEQVQALLDAGKALGTPIVVPKETERQVALVPEGYEVKALEEFVAKLAPAPRRIKAKVTLATPNSFMRYVKEYQNPQTRLFRVTSTVGAIYAAYMDFYLPGQPSWAEHSAHFTLLNTPEWQAWTNMNGHQMATAEFAAFIEKNMGAVVSPPGADMLELVQTLEGTNNATYTQMQRLSNGKQKVSYEENVTLRGTVSTETGAVEFPTLLGLGLSPFEGTPAYRMDCRLRYRLNSGRITLFYELVDPHLIVKAAVRDIDEILTKELGITPLEGTFQNGN